MYLKRELHFISIEDRTRLQNKRCIIVNRTENEDGGGVILWDATLFIIYLCLYGISELFLLYTYGISD